MPIPDHLIPILRAVLSRIVPTDQDPGVVELRGEVFIEDRTGENPELESVYSKGLSALFEQDFQNLAEEYQDELLQAYEIKYPDFMNLVVQHSMEAFYTSAVGLKMVGFEVTI